MKILVIGIGNPLRGDDALGAEAIRALEARPLPPQVETIHVQQLSLDLVEDLGTASLALFVDARRAEPPGLLHAEELEPDTCLESSAVSHFFDPAALLAAVQALYGRHPRARLFSVNARTFGFGAPLSPEVQAALPALVKRILLALPPTQTILPMGREQGRGKNQTQVSPTRPSPIQAPDSHE